VDGKPGNERRQRDHFGYGRPRGIRLIERPAQRRNGLTSNTAEYRRVFVTRVHQLLQLGYSRLNAKTCVKEEETSITGFLAEAMDNVIDDPASARWVRHFNVHDDPPINDSGDRKGKRRRRIDIKLVSSERWPRSRFSFEAKRLGKTSPLSEYLGTKGIGCFIAGQYASQEPDGGMLGYIQAGTIDEWQTQLKSKFDNATEELALCAGNSWKKHAFRSGPDYTFRSRHVRRTLGREIDIYHTLFVFC
jgi:hypothetical protein